MDGVEIKSIISKGETQTIEFKKSANKEIIHEAVAFANTKGGLIFIGVSDDGTISGTNTSNSERGRIENTLSNIDPKLKIDVNVIDNIIIIHVPEGKNKPYMCSDGFYIRENTQTKKLTREEIYEMFLSEEQFDFDDRINYNAKYQDEFSNETYSQYINLSGITNSHSIENNLLNLSCAVKENGTIYLTNAGVLFFSKEPVKIIPQSNVVCALYKGLDKTTILDRKDFSESIIENINNAMKFLERHLNLRYEITELKRREILDVPIEALREAVVNAVCHRNYLEKGAQIMIEIYDDRVVITNPGGLVKGLDKSMFGKLSIRRNRVIADLLQRANYIEKMGTGISRINTSMNDAHLPKPDYSFGSSFFMITLYRDSYIRESDIRTNASFNSLSELDKKILSIIHIDSSINSTVIAEKTGCSRSTVSREIKKLKESGYLIRSGSNKNGLWIIQNLSEDTDN